MQRWMRLNLNLQEKGIVEINAIAMIPISNIME